MFSSRLESLVTHQKLSNRIVRYFSDTHLGNGHDGLRKLAKDSNVDLMSLRHGEFVVFVNKKKNALKLFASGYVIAHLKLPNGERINPRTIALLPKFFNGTEINYSNALKEVIKQEYPSFFGN